MTTLINLYGAPCSGKSTQASKLYTQLKEDGYSVELVREFATEWAWQDRSIGPYDHIFIVANQIHRETNLYDKVDYLITDSPVLLGAFYDELKFKHLLTRDMVKLFMESRKAHVTVLDYWLPLNTQYLRQEARYHSFKEIQEINIALKNYLTQFRVYPDDISELSLSDILGGPL